MDGLEPIEGTTLVLAPHPDDEVILCGALMQKMQRAWVVFATDGAPRHPSFWKQHGSRQAYAEVRRQEARAALGAIGAWPIFLADRVEGGIADQELFDHLPAAASALEKIIARLRPQGMLVPAYEGGHPDHDACCFLGWVAGRRFALPVWEAPLYHARRDGSRAVQAFPRATGKERELRIEPRALRRKISMFHAYRSQAPALAGFHPARETFRPLASYDFLCPPVAWKLNYELWGWPMHGRQVASAFAVYLQARALSAKPA